MEEAGNIVLEVTDYIYIILLLAAVVLAIVIVFTKLKKKIKDLWKDDENDGVVINPIEKEKKHD